MVTEFVASARPTFEADAEAPAWLADLAAYEGALWEVSDLDASEPGGARELAFERAPWLSPALRLVALRHAVHESANAGGAYVEAPTYLCVHRASDRAKPGTWTLNLSTYRLLCMWQADATLSITGAVRKLASERGIVVDQVFIDGLCGVLAEFLDAGIVLGSR